MEFCLCGKKSILTCEICGDLICENCQAPNKRSQCYSCYEENNLLKLEYNLRRRKKNKIKFKED